LAASPGQPIGGIIVKGSRNSGGQMLTMTTDENGEFSLYISEAGNYKIIITTPKMEHWGDPHENLNGKH